MSLVTRFAPSPNGYLHLGHALSALTCQRIAEVEHGRMLLRIEDIDPERCRPEFEQAIYEDLAWLGLSWEQTVRRQSDHMETYMAALARLQEMNVVYPCFCTRAEIAEASDEPGHYPGICRNMDRHLVEEKIAANEKPAWRLDAHKALARTGPLTWHDREKGTLPVLADFGDVVIARKDVPTSYHLSVTVDDHLQGITLVVRGMDLFTTTPIHRTLQALLGYETPEYFHHPLLLDPTTGNKLAKRDGSTALRVLRQQGINADEVKRRVLAP